MVSALVPGSNGPGSPSPGKGIYVVYFGKTLLYSRNSFIGRIMVICPLRWSLSRHLQPRARQNIQSV